MLTHKLWLKPNGKLDNKTPQVISIYYKRSDNYRKQCKTDYKVCPIHWDSKNKVIKSQFLDLYPDVQQGLDNIRAAFTKQYELLNKGEATIDTVFENLTFKRDLNGTVREFLQRTNNYSYNSLKGYNDKLDGIEKHLGKPLTINQLGDRSEILRIKKVFEESPSLGNGAASYMTMLRTLAGNFDFDTKKIYKDSIPKQTQNIKEGIPPLRIKNGINNINTIQQLEAYLLWLYSFCLKSMTGNDLPNLDVNWLVFENNQIPLNHYHQYGEFIKSEDPYRPSFSSKVHYLKNRGKTGRKAKGLYNAFPILFIKDWLRYCISIGHPEYEYKGDDPIRLYNFKTKDEKGNPIPDGVKNWISLRNVYRKTYKRCFNGSLHRARHSYNNCMRRLSLNGIEQRQALSHKVNDALGNYVGEFDVEVKDNLHQFEVIDQYDIIGIVEMLAKKFAKAKDEKDRPYMSPKVYVEWTLVSHLMKFEIDEYNWSNEDEKIYQKLLDDLKFKGIGHYDNQGNWISREPNENDFEGRLLLLHNRRKELKKTEDHVILGKPKNKNSINFKLVIKPDWANTDPNEKNFFTEQELLGKSEEIFK